MSKRPRRVVRFPTPTGSEVDIDLDAVVGLGRGPSGNTIFTQEDGSKVETAARWDDLTQKVYQAIRGPNWDIVGGGNLFEHQHG